MNSCQNIKLLKHTNTYSHSHLAFPSHSNPLQYSFFNALASPFSLSILISIYLSFTYPLLIFHQNRTHTSLLLLYKVYIILIYFNRLHPYKKNFLSQIPFNFLTPSSLLPIISLLSSSSNLKNSNIHCSYQLTKFITSLFNPTSIHLLFTN